LILAVVALFLPGAALLAWLPARGRSLPEHLATSFGLSLAFVSLAALAGWILGVSFSVLSIAVFLLLSAIAVAAAFIIRRPFLFRRSSSALAALALCAALLGLRLFQARELAFPAWVDSIHHALIVRVFLEQGGLPSSLAPYLPVPFYYHFGFHAAAAVVAALSRQSPDTVLLVFGQILQVMAVLSVYRLCMALRRDSRAALLAMALTGFVSEMPAFYLSWGRYTLLAGLVLLPLAMAEALEYLHRAPRSRTAVRLALLTAGTLLTHYLAGLLLAAFLILLVIFHARESVMRRRLAVLALAASAGAALAGPWLARMIGYAASGINPVLTLPFGNADAAARLADWDYFLNLIGPERNTAFLMFGLIGAVAILFMDRRWRPFAVWGLLLGVLALPWGFRLAPFRPDHLTILLYLPAAILVSTAVWMLADRCLRARPRGKTYTRILLGTGALLICLAGAWETRAIVNPVTILADAGDRAALAWVTANTPPTARFLINVTYWQADLYRGTDGGWWLLPATGRQSVLPPALYGMGDEAYAAGVTKTAKAVAELQGCTPAFWNILRTEQLSYIYIHDGKGGIQPDQLNTCPDVHSVYKSGGVHIYQAEIKGKEVPPRP
jgi:hypothetical protein